MSYLAKATLLIITMFLAVLIGITVGWFGGLYPVSLALSMAPVFGSLVSATDRVSVNLITSTIDFLRVSIGGSTIFVLEAEWLKVF
jgi:NhaP-type Na+/H+ or K+/H+ antiporter